MEQKEIYLLIISASVTSLVFSVSLVVLLVLYQKRRDTYRRELTKVRVEINEQTLQNISWEIHDNIGQILSTLNLYSYKVHDSVPVELESNVEEMQDLIQTAITEVRTLSKVLNTDYVKSVGLVKTTKLELERFRRLKFLETSFIIKGEAFTISDDTELILLRILQEFFSNTIKHSGATKLDVKFTYNKNVLDIDIKDNGLGFESDQEMGTGILNMRNRAKLIGAFLNLESKSNHGTELKIIYKRKN